MSAQDFYLEFDNTTDQLQRFALKLTRDMDHARDLYQETAYRAFKYKDKFQLGTNFKAWATTLMKNIFINDFRKQQRRKVRPAAPDDVTLVNHGAQTRNGGETQLALEEIMLAINKLERKYSLPFWRYYQGFSYQEIADELDLPLGTVKSHIHLARKQLKDSLKFLQPT